MAERGLDRLWVGLQEWAVICSALAAGDLCAVVRKGGIHEARGGLFELQQPRFLLLPTYLHQDGDRLQPAWRDRLADLGPDPDPGRLQITLWAEAAGVWRVTDPRRLEDLAAVLPWTGDELRRRFRYRDEPWLALVALRIHRLPQTVVRPFLPRYRGCRSWIPLEDPVPLEGSTPVIDDPTWAARLEALRALAAP